MYTRPPRLFDRHFAIGYILPVILFLLVTYGVLRQFGLLEDLPARMESDLLGWLALLAALTFFISLILVVLNLEIIRTLAGFGRFNPARLLIAIERGNFKRLYNAIDYLDEQYRKHEEEGKPFPMQLNRRRDLLWHVAASRFPERLMYVQPTAFGNTLRAFEAYPRVMYGLDGRAGWARLLAVIPDAYHREIATTKAYTDFWINLWLFSVAVLVEYGALTVIYGDIRALYIPLLALAAALFTSWRARHAAADWGELVNAAFDVFLVDLYEKLGVEIPPTRDDERAFWQNFSVAVRNRFADDLPERNTSQPDDTIDEN
ncbi:MAG: hypothetical protein D6712_13255 [Chloroflexi bacterium]|nr:MAG: hypothetical protein D6712_13255 [Chloroflexota bacterium]